MNITNFVSTLIIKNKRSLVEQILISMEPLQKNTQNIITEQDNLTKEQAQHVYMWTSFMDQFGNTHWAMLKRYSIFFRNFLTTINTLRQTINNNWKQQELKEYFRFLDDLTVYINAYIFTGQVADLNMFYDAMLQYGNEQNQIGKLLYQTQLNFLQRRQQQKQQGHDFRLDNRKNKVYKPKNTSQNNQHKIELQKQRKFTNKQIRQLEQEGFTTVRKPKYVSKQGQKIQQPSIHSKKKHYKQKN